MFVAMELANRADWWDLFCSDECCRAVHGDERPETFVTAEDFQDRTGVNLRKGKDRVCFHCDGPLKLDAPKLTIGAPRTDCELCLGTGVELVFANGQMCRCRAFYV